MIAITELHHAVHAEDCETETNAAKSKYLSKKVDINLHILCFITFVGLLEQARS
jgi:hypothetical protein